MHLIRETAITQIKQALAHVKGGKRYVDRIEEGVFDVAKEQCLGAMHSTFDLDIPLCKDLYVDLLKKVWYNIQNPRVIKEFSARKKLRTIAGKSHIELNPDKWEVHVKRREMNNKRVDVQQEQTTDQFRCGKCKQNKCTYYGIQIRSADEPETIFITCVNPGCGNKWRMG